MAILDPPLIEYAIRQNPDWDIHQLPLTADPERYPILATKYNIIFGINPELEELHGGRQRGDREDLGRLRQRRVDEGVRHGRSELVHSARSQPQNRG